MVLSIGEPSPWFNAKTLSTDSFQFDTMAGRYVLLCFLPEDPASRGGLLEALSAHRSLFDDVKISAFVVVQGKNVTVQAQDARGLRWFIDPDSEIGKLYEIHDATGAQTCVWILLDPNLRILGHTTGANTAAVFNRLGKLPPVDEHSGGEVMPPVLIVPRVFEPELCSRLIEAYDSGPTEFTGVMQDIDGKTVAVMDAHKSRRDLRLTDTQATDPLKSLIERRLFPEMRKAFQFEASRIERYIVSCYDAADGGVFHPHRDNTNVGTAYRRFACSINLNDGFEGGDLRFPEYSRQTFRPPPGGAVVFSCSLIHEVTPVTVGRRYAFLPFIHDEAAEGVLEAYRKSLAQA